MVGLLSRSGNNSFTLSNRRSFDAWGNVRLGASTGDPTGRYCANLGHKQDDESGLIYMRARYYEPTSGRFLSEDPAARGTNWYSYCSSDPVSQADPTGLEGSGSLTEQGIVQTVQDILGDCDGGSAAEFENWYIDAAARYIGSEQIEVVIQLVDEDSFAAEMGGGHWNGEFSREISRILIQLKPSGMNPTTFCHELGESMCRGIQEAFGDSFAMTHGEAQAMLEEIWENFFGGG